MNLRQRLMLEWVVIGVLASIAVILALGWRGTSSFDSLLYDQVSSINRPAADENILIVSIDDVSLSQIGKWPWSRDLHAQALSRIKKSNPRSVTLDILFSEAGDPENDKALAKTIAQSPASFIPLHHISPGSDGRLYDVEEPIPQIAAAAAGIGHVNLEFDDDGSVRRAALCFSADNSWEARPHLMELVYRGTKSQAPSPTFERDDCSQPVLIPYAPRGAFAQISYVDILNSEIPADLIKGRDVIIGATASGMGDSYPVPYADGGVLSGSEIMANMLSGLRQDSFIYPLNYYTNLALSLLPIWLLMLIFILTPPRTALIASLAFIASLLLGSAAAMGMQLWFPPGAALLGILIIYPLWGWRRLQSVSNFMDGELKQLQSEDAVTPFTKERSRANDMVGRQTAALSGAIDQIRDLQKFVGDVLSDLPDPMVVTNREGEVTLTSDKVKERFGQDIIGKKLVDIMEGNIAPDYLKSVQNFIGVTTSNLDAKQFIRFSTNDGRTFVMRQSAARNDNGEYVGRISYLADISALAEAEAQREEVLQLLSHDMRAPQSAIIASLEGRIDKAVRKRIEHNARRTMRLAQDFVDMARMTETEFIGEELLIADLTRDVADNLWPLSQEREVKIEIIEKAEAVFVLAEPDQLFRAISNLLDNAIKFSPADTKITATIGRIEIGNEANAILEIADEGSGIDEELMPRLFTRFATSDKEKRRAEGSGLGLTHVEAVAKRHGGSIKAENKRDGGAIFTLILPESIEI